jgi:hypothetical protein
VGVVVMGALVFGFWLLVVGCWFLVCVGGFASIFQVILTESPFFTIAQSHVATPNGGTFT